MGRYDEAIVEYERILKLNPNYPLIHFHLAQAYERKGQKDQARTEYTRFLEVWKDADADIPEVVNARKLLAEQSERMALLSGAKTELTDFSLTRLVTILVTKWKDLDFSVGLASTFRRQKFKRCEF